MKEKIFICIIVVLLIVIAIMGVQLAKGSIILDIPEKKETATNREDELIRIHFNEDLSKEGTVEGIEGLQWNNININVDEFSIRVDLTLENRTEKNIEAQKLKVSLYNKEGKEIATKEVETPAIEANKHGFIDIDFSKEEGSDYEVIYDVKIFANK